MYRSSPILSFVFRDAGHHSKFPGLCDIFASRVGLIHSSVEYDCDYIKQIFSLKTKSGCGQTLDHETTKIIVKTRKIGTGRGRYLVQENFRSKTDEEEKEGKGGIYWRRKIKFTVKNYL